MARPAPGADRAVAVLDLLARHPDHRFTLSEVARRCDLNKATAHALLTTLSGHGILLRHPDEKRYSLGPRLVAIGDAARRGYSALDFAPPVLERVATETGALVRAVRCQANHLVAAASVGQGPEDAVVWGRRPLVPPAGVVFMAWADSSSVEAWLARAASGDVVQPVLAALDGVRRDGWAVLAPAAGRDRGMDDQMTAGDLGAGATARGRAADEGTDPGVTAPGGTAPGGTAPGGTAPGVPLVTEEIEDDEVVHVAEVDAPVFGLGGEVDLAVSCHLGDRMLTGAHLRQVGACVAAAAHELTRVTGGSRGGIPTPA